MHHHAETGNAFTITDLWEESGRANFEQHGNGYLIETERTLFAPLKSGGNGRDCGDEKPIGIPISPNTTTPGDYFSLKFTLPCSKDLDLHLPDLTSFEYGPTENLESLELSSTSSTTTSNSLFPIQEQEEEDVWSSASILVPGPVPAELKSWERFYDRSLRQPRTAYISEAGPSAFDAILALPSTNSQSDVPKDPVGHVVQYGPVLMVVFPPSYSRLESRLTPN